MLHTQYTTQIDNMRGNLSKRGDTEQLKQTVQIQHPSFSIQSYV